LESTEEIQENCDSSDSEYSELLDDSEHDYSRSYYAESSSGYESESYLFASSDDESCAFPSTTRNLPWPDDHNDFLRSSTTKQNLCIEIASGYAADHEPTWIDRRRTIRTARGKLKGEKKKMGHPLRECDGPVLLPGSLRERGEFCILELALIDQHKTKTKPVVSTKHDRKFAWEVQAVKFHRMD
jgi:hypothetical protein